MANNNTEIAAAKALLKTHRKEKALSMWESLKSGVKAIPRVRPAFYLAEPKPEPVAKEEPVLSPDDEMQREIESDAQDPTVNTQEVN